MITRKKTTNRSSEYWDDFEGELSVYYSFIWNNYESIKYFISNEKEFINNTNYWLLNMDCYTIK